MNIKNVQIEQIIPYINNPRHNENAIDEVRQMTKGQVPVVVLKMSEAERKCLTIRINRAKGSHVAIKMSEIIQSLINEHGMSVKQICEEIGATKNEVDLLMMDNVFKALDIENKKFSHAWYPNK